MLLPPATLHLTVIKVTEFVCSGDDSGWCEGFSVQVCTGGWEHRNLLTSPDPGPSPAVPGMQQDSVRPPSTQASHSKISDCLLGLCESLPG